MGLALFLGEKKKKTLFTQTEPIKQLPPKSKFTQVARKPILCSKFTKPIPSKCMRQDSNEELEEGYDHRKKKAVFINDQIAEANKQPR